VATEDLRVVVFLSLRCGLGLAIVLDMSTYTNEQATADALEARVMEAIIDLGFLPMEPDSCESVEALEEYGDAALPAWMADEHYAPYVAASRNATRDSVVAVDFDTDEGIITTYVMTVSGVNRATVTFPLSDLGLAMWVAATEIAVRS
jgi:hypothetical protein